MLTQLLFKSYLCRNHVDNKSEKKKIYVLFITDTLFWEAKMTQFVRETNTYIGKVKLTIVLTQRHEKTVTKLVNGKNIILSHQNTFLWNIFSEGGTSLSFMVCTRTVLVKKWTLRYSLSLFLSCSGGPKSYPKKHEQKDSRSRWARSYCAFLV